MAKVSSKDLAAKLQAMYKAKKKNCKGISTGSDIKIPDTFVIAPAPIQELLGLPGYPFNRITMISGVKDSGKTSLSMHAMVEAQKAGYQVVSVDTEGKFSKDRFIKMGGNPEEVLNGRVSTLEEAYDFIFNSLDVIFSENPDAYVFISFDSLGNTPSETQSETDPNDTMQMAIPPKINKRNLNVLVPKYIDKKNICMMIINTNYANIGSMGRKEHGGEAAQYASSIMLQLSRVSDICKMVNGQRMKEGIETKAVVVKNHIQQGDLTLKDIRFVVKAYTIEKAKEKKKNDKDEEEVNDDN